MKIFISLFSLFFVLTTGFSQKKDIEVFEKKDGSKIIVVVRNTGTTDCSVTLTITSKGMEVSPSAQVESMIPAGFMKEIATLMPIPGKDWEYSYDVAFTQTREKTPVKTTETTPSTLHNSTSTKQSTTQTNADLHLSTSDVILYSKPGCSRCSFVKQQLSSLNIPFEEYSTTSGSPEINNMWVQLRNSGFDGGSVTMPVVRANGKYYYNIPDLKEFVAKLKKS
jgi:glutaredoxin